MSTITQVDIPKCKLCDYPVESQDYCYGCESYICQECNTYPEVPAGKHQPVAHIKLRAAISERDKWQRKIDELTGEANG